MYRKGWIAVMGMAAILVLSACGMTGTSLSLTHIHGLGYGTNDQLAIATHEGVLLTDGNQWSAAEGDPHDLMGFSVAKSAWYSSGHPAPGSDKPNPLGLMKSTDGGKTWDSLSLEGLSDFHFLAAGYESGAIYVIHEHPHPEMDMGLHVTEDEGKTWSRSAMQGVGSYLTLGAHPIEPNIVAVGSDRGLFLSQDYGDTFEKIHSDNLTVTALLFDLHDPDVIWMGGYHESLTFGRYHLKTKEWSEIPLPLHDPDEAIQFIAQNPGDPDQMAVATVDKQILMTDNAGEDWTFVMKGGKVLE